VKLLLHALSTDEVPSETPGGLRGQALARVEAAGLVGWATRCREPDPKFGRADLLEHHQIISRLHEQVDACLPARFPTWYVDEAALRGEIVARRGELEAALDAVRGRCELAVTVLWTAPAEALTPTESPTPGTRYLRERQQAFAGSDQRRARAKELADEIEQLAGTDLVAVRRQVCPSAAVAVSSALLAPRARANALIARLPRARDGVRILVNGPWPPYTFADTGASTRHNSG
jgi:Gas vesicle synthesis protein GvpL/GvpF